MQDRDRLLRDRAARYETILRAAGEGVIVTNAGGMIEEANKAAGRMFGAQAGGADRPAGGGSGDQPAGRPADTTDHRRPGDHRHQVARHACRAGGRDGSTFWLEVNLKPVQLRDRVVVTCIFRDVTQRKEAEERVRRMNDELETRVRQRTAELEEANTKLEVAFRQAEAAARRRTRSWRT